MIQPINGNILIEPITQETAWATSQTSYEERGTILALADDVTRVKLGDVVYFDSWQAARFKDGEQKDIWLVHIDAVRAYESSLPE